jgi:hypothetical protein
MEWLHTTSKIAAKDAEGVEVWSLWRIYNKVTDETGKLLCWKLTRLHSTAVFYHDIHPIYID